MIKEFYNIYINIIDERFERSSYEMIRIYKVIFFIPYVFITIIFFLSFAYIGNYLRGKK